VTVNCNSTLGLMPVPLLSRMPNPLRCTAQLPQPPETDASQKPVHHIPETGPQEKRLVSHPMG
jgi:hypothetical protein